MARKQLGISPSAILFIIALFLSESLCSVQVHYGPIDFNSECECCEMLSIDNQIRDSENHSCKMWSCPSEVRGLPIILPLDTPDNYGEFGESSVRDFAGLSPPHETLLHGSVQLPFALFTIAIVLIVGITGKVVVGLHYEPKLTSAQSDIRSLKVERFRHIYPSPPQSISPKHSPAFEFSDVFNYPRKPAAVLKISESA